MDVQRKQNQETRTCESRRVHRLFLGEVIHPPVRRELPQKTTTLWRPQRYFSLLWTFSSRGAKCDATPTRSQRHDTADRLGTSVSLTGRERPGLSQRGCRNSSLAMREVQRASCSAYLVCGRVPVSGSFRRGLGLLPLWQTCGEGGYGSDDPLVSDCQNQGPRSIQSFGLAIRQEHRQESQQRRNLAKVVVKNISRSNWVLERASLVRSECLIA